MHTVPVPFIVIIFSLHQIMKEIQEHKIKIYEFPDTEDDEDNKLIRKIKVTDNPGLFIKTLTERTAHHSKRTKHYSHRAVCLYEVTLLLACYLPKSSAAL